MNGLIYGLYHKQKYVGEILGMKIFTNDDLPKGTLVVYDGAGNQVAKLNVIEEAKER